MRKPIVMIVDGHGNDHIYELIVPKICDVIDVAVFDDTSMALRAARVQKFDLLIVGHDLPPIEVSDFLSRVSRLPGKEMIYVALLNDCPSRATSESSGVDIPAPLKRLLCTNIGTETAIVLSIIFKYIGIAVDRRK